MSDIQKIQQAVSEYADKKTAIAAIKEQLKVAEAEVLRYEREVIPNLMKGVPKIETAEGIKVSIEDKVKGSIQKGFEPVAHDAMVELETRHFGDAEVATAYVATLWTKEVTIKDYEESFIQALIDNGIAFDRKLAIHHATLSKWLLSVYERGLSVPDVIKAFAFKQANITGLKETTNDE